MQTSVLCILVALAGATCHTPRLRSGPRAAPLAPDSPAQAQGAVVHFAGASSEAKEASSGVAKAGVVHTNAGTAAAALIKARDQLASVTAMRHRTRLTASFATLQRAGELPEWAQSMTGCVHVVNKTLADLARTYLPAHVHTALDQACDNAEVSSDIGGSAEVCKELMKELAAEYNGQRNYFPWCRSLTLASYKALQKADELFEANQTLVALREECSEHCPYIAKVIEASAKIGTMFASAAAEVSPQSMAEILEMAARQLNQLCDWYSKAQCKPRNMHSSCTELLGGVPNFAVEELEELMEMCEMQEPCKMACPVVSSSLVDMAVAQSRMLFEMPVPNVTHGTAFCEALQRVSRCAEKEEMCEKFLTHSAGGVGFAEYAHSWDSTCHWFEGSCASTRMERCAPEVRKVREEMPSASLFFGALDCDSLEELVECDAKEGCVRHLTRGLEALDPSLKDMISEMCPEVGRQLVA